MKLHELKELDPQRVVTVRFGMMSEEDEEISWQDHWTDVRLLVALSPDTFVLIPLTLDGRPMGFELMGHDNPDETKGIFAAENTPHVMQIRSFLEKPSVSEVIDRFCDPNEPYENLETMLANEMIFYDDLSPEGKVLITAIVEMDKRDLIGTEAIAAILRDVYVKL